LPKSLLPHPFLETAAVDKTKTDMKTQKFYIPKKNIVGYAKLLAVQNLNNS
jgi:hypothetical protein